MKRWFFGAVASCVLGFTIAQGDIDDLVLFKSGDAGYECFRIPALVSTGGREVFAFCEGRKEGCNDFGNVDIVMRWSENGGATWSPLKVVAEFGDLQAGNPAPVWDESNPDHPDGVLMLFYNTGTASEWEVRSGQGRRQGWFTTSTDHGQTWTTPENISHFIHFDAQSDHPEMDERTLAFTPGHAIQLKHPAHAGRLYVAANHSSGPPQSEFADYRSVGFYSDDHGQTWERSENVAYPSSNEAMAVECADGLLQLNIRIQDGAIRRRLIAESNDGGVHWDSIYVDEQLVSPVCQGSVLRARGDTLVYVGPNDEWERRNLSLWMDVGGGWLTPKLIHPGFAAYSDCVSLRPGQIGVLFEAEAYSEIRFKTMSLN